MNPPGRTIALLLCGVLLGVGIAVALTMGPVPQNPVYHDFADGRPCVGLSNAGNVVSNLPFLAIGIWGWVSIVRMVREGRGYRERWELVAWTLFAGSLIGVAFGSSWYHLRPDNDRLVWDRLPMTLAFMSLFALALGDRFAGRVGKIALGPLVVLGLGSVLFWHLGERRGAGDLRPYGLVQFLPMVWIPILVFLCPASYTGGRDWLAALAWYGAAKLAESGDRWVYGFGEVVSGHTLKHLFAAIGTAILIRTMRRRQPL